MLVIYIELESPDGDLIEFEVSAMVEHDPGDWWQPPDTTVDIHEVHPAPSWEFTNDQDDAIETAILAAN